MNKLFWTLLFLCLFISSNTKAQSPSKAADIWDYAKHLKNHKNLYANIKEKEFDHYIQSLANKSELLDKETIWVELLKLNAIIKDEHTNLFPLESEKSLPFYFSTFEEGVLSFRCKMTRCTCPICYIKWWLSIMYPLKRFYNS